METIDTDTAFIITMLSFVVMAALAWVFGWLTKTHAARRFAVRPSLKWLIAAYPLILLAEYFGQTLHPVPADPVVEQLLTNWTWWQTMLTIVIAAPLAEEYAFRGVMLVWLREKLGGRVNDGVAEAIAVIVPALCWAALHVQYDLVWMGVIAVAGVVLGLIRTRGGSLWLVIGIHAANNAVALVGV